MRSLDTLLFDVLKPGLSRADLEQLTQEICPGLTSSIDSTVAKWWGWQNGTIPGEMQAIRRDSPEYSDCDVLTPDDYRTSTLHALLEKVVLMFGPSYQPDWLEFPIASRIGGGQLAVRRPKASDEWTMWFNLKVDPGWRPLDEHRGEAPTFSDWLTALSKGIESGYISVDQWAKLAVPANDKDRRQTYPWNTKS